VVSVKIGRGKLWYQLSRGRRLYIIIHARTSKGNRLF